MTRYHRQKLYTSVVFCILLLFSHSPGAGSLSSRCWIHPEAALLSSQMASFSSSPTAALPCLSVPRSLLLFLKNIWGRVGVFIAAWAFL